MIGNSIIANDPLFLGFCVLALLVATYTPLPDARWFDRLGIDGDARKYAIWAALALLHFAVRASYLFVLRRLVCGSQRAIASNSLIPQRTGRRCRRLACWRSDHGTCQSNMFMLCSDVIPESLTSSATVITRPGASATGKRSHPVRP